MIEQNLKKRIIIGCVYTAIFSLIGFFMWYVITPNASCTDGKKNQSEKGVDCGGPCSPCKDIGQSQNLVIQETAFANGGNNLYDVVAKIINPNDTSGASVFDYTFTLKDTSGQVIATRQGKSFILPADTRYVVELGLDTKDNVAPATVEFSASNAQWATLGDVQKPQLSIFNKKYGPLPAGIGSEAEGIMRNDSIYDLSKVTIAIILRDQSGKIIGINTTEKSTIRSKEERDFRLTWPYTLSGDVFNVEVDAESNVFDPLDFISVSSS